MLSPYSGFLKAQTPADTRVQVSAIGFLLTISLRDDIPSCIIPFGVAEQVRSVHLWLRRESARKISTVIRDCQMTLMTGVVPVRKIDACC